MEVRAANWHWTTVATIVEALEPLATILSARDDAQTGLTDIVTRAMASGELTASKRLEARLVVLDLSVNSSVSSSEREDACEAVVQTIVRGKNALAHVAALERAGLTEHCDLDRDEWSLEAVLGQDGYHARWFWFAVASLVYRSAPEGAELRLANVFHHVRDFWLSRIPKLSEEIRTKLLEELHREFTRERKMRPQTEVWPVPRLVCPLTA